MTGYWYMDLLVFILAAIIIVGVSCFDIMDDSNQKPACTAKA